MPRAPRFTERNIIAEAQPGKRLFVRDTPGLYLYTSAGPKKRQRWIFRFSRPHGGGVTERSLGRYPDVTLEIAKNTVARVRLIMARDKIDPWKTNWNEGATTTFEQAADMWLNERKGSWKNAKQFRSTELLLRVHADPLHHMAVLKITSQHIRDALKPLWDRVPGQARRTLARIENVLEFCKVKQMRFGDNPARWRGAMEYMFPRMPKAQRENYAAMDYEDVPAFVQALRQRQGSSVAAVALEFTILTAVRSAEVLGMRWCEVDWDRRIWTIPATRTKASREHMVPLADRAIELLKRREELAAEHSAGGYVFFAFRRQDRPLDEKSMYMLLRKMGKGVTVHGFRSSFRDWAGDETDFHRETIEGCLAHVAGDKVEQAYRRRTALEKRRAVMDDWAKWCAKGFGPGLRLVDARSTAGQR
jgi:integrase